MGVNHAPEGVKINEAGLSAQLPVQPETAPESKISTPLENAIADIIAKTFADELAKAGKDVATNAVDTQGNEHSEANGRFVPKGEDGGSIFDKTSENKATNYTAEHRAKVGQSGDWKSLYLPPLHDLTPDEPRGKTKIADARERIAKGESIKDPLGASHEINAKTTSHWTKKGKKIADVNERLALLDEAEVTISKPHEIWKGEKRNGTAFIRMVKTPGGKVVINVAEMKDGTVIWHWNEVSFDYWREGRLLYVR